MKAINNYISKLGSITNRKSIKDLTAKSGLDRNQRQYINNKGLVDTVPQVAWKREVRIN